MGAAQSYRHYPDSIKLEVVKSKNPYHYPELEIPRTTALYWIKKSKKIISTEPKFVESERIQKLQNRIDQQQSLLNLVHRARFICRHGFQSGKSIFRPQRKKVVAAIQEAGKLNRIGDCLKAIGLSKKIYGQWLSEFFLCQSEIGSCDQRRPQQLTAEEIKTMKRLVTSKKYSHVTIHSLCLLAQRENFLFCSIDSWYKYIRIFGWLRSRAVTKETVERIGIRAKMPNEMWHIDVTEVKTINNEIVYIQIVYDNFSRYVIAWKITSEIGGLSTVDLLEKAKAHAISLGSLPETKVIMDGGPENDNARVLNFTTSKSMRRLIARVDIHFSNSMAESLFRSLKSNFLNTEELMSKSDVENKINFYFSEHNNNIPKAIFKGATPKEIYLNLWNAKKAQELKDGLKLAMENRKKVYNEKSCLACVM